MSDLSERTYTAVERLVQQGTARNKEDAFRKLASEEGVGVTTITGRYYTHYRALGLGGEPRRSRSDEYGLRPVARLTARSIAVKERERDFHAAKAEALNAEIATLMKAQDIVEPERAKTTA